MTKKQRAEYLLVRLEQLYPETPIPLDHKDAYTLLIAVLLSAQCTDVRVNLVTPALFALCKRTTEMRILDSGLRKSRSLWRNQRLCNASAITLQRAF